MRHLSTDLHRNRQNLGNGVSGENPRYQRPTRLRHPHLPPLFYSAQNRRWVEVRRRSRSHPHEIFVQEDISGNTPLHVACRHDPPSDIVRCLLATSDVRNAEGATPLHVAASHRCSADVIKTLIENVARDDVQNDDRGILSPQKGGSAVAALTRIGRAPIHYACMSFRGLSVGAFKVLLEATLNSPAHSSSVTTDDDNDDCDDISLMSKEDEGEIVDRSASTNIMTLRDGTGQTPLGLLFRRYRERVRCVIKMVESNATSTGNNGASSQTVSAAAQAVQADLGELWEKARLIVCMMADHHFKQDDSISDMIGACSSPAENAAAMEAAAWAASKYQVKVQPDDQPKVDGRTFRIVHASVGLTGYGCPPEMVRLAISVHPNQVREMDEDGNLPLHIAAVASSYAPTSDALDENDHSRPAASDDDSLMTSNTFMSGFSMTENRHAFDNAIRILLKHYPASARIPHGKSGRLPFSLAVEAGRRTWNDGIKTLLRAYPGALESRDLELKLYPSILTLIGKHDGNSDCKKRRGSIIKSRSESKPLTSLFELVKARPNIVEEGIIQLAIRS